MCQDILKILCTSVIILSIISCSDHNNINSLSVADKMAIQDTIDILTDKLAQAISNRDAKAASDRVPMDTSIVYISNGIEIQGNEYTSILENFYNSMKSINFSWTAKEINVLDKNNAVMIGWAKISSIDTLDVKNDDDVIFTMYYHKDLKRWNYIISQKTSIKK
ncbi:MAG: hypothetical protein MUP85_15880 [Candidatus Lokiarchaeota archaeon]|nr:hypothetical protein [Candidatus Lokiarchaeota archaeon]